MQFSTLFNCQTLVCILMLLLHNEIDGQVHSILDVFTVPYRSFHLGFARSLRSAASTSGYKKSLIQKEKLQPNFVNMKFPCDTQETRSNPKPTSVHKLRPGDIDIVGAIGDSLTAGFGITALNILQVFNENRGESFSIGGAGTWRDTLTVPNILKVFNPKLFGYSLRSSLSIERASQFNTAEGGAVSNEMPYMSKILIKRIVKDPRVNLKEDWKMITVFMGSNDFCTSICYDGTPSQILERHRKDLTQVLRIFRDNLPRTVVNVIPAPHMRLLRNFTGKSSFCHYVHRVECPCMFGPLLTGKEKMYDDLMYRWQELDAEITKLPEFDLDDFTVVFQPFILNYTFPTTPKGHTDFSYLSADCFHFSQKGQARVANNLWNNLLEPLGKKSIDGSDIFQKFNCPSKEHPYIFTRRNS